MGTLKNKFNRDLKRTRTTWLAGKLDMNYARLNALLKGRQEFSSKEKKDITSILRNEAIAKPYFKKKKKR